jgi:hypothetical protein
MTRAINAIFLILLSNIIFINSLRNEAVRKGVEVQIKELQGSWNLQFEKLHLLAEQCFALHGKGKDLPAAEFSGYIEAAFPLNTDNVDKIPVNILNYWLSDIEDEGETVSLDEAYKILQNEVITGVLINLYAGIKFQAAGPFKAGIEAIVQALTQSHEKLQNLSQDIFNQADENHNGQIDVQEFKKSYSKYLPLGANAEADFKLLDLDNSGYLDVNETTHVFGKYLLESNTQIHVPTRRNNVSHSNQGSKGRGQGRGRGRGKGRGRGRGGN